MNLNRTLRICSVLLPALFLPAGQTAADEPGTDTALDEALAVSLLLFEEEEPGTGAYPVRYLINEAWLRIDDGYDTSDYILLDRETGIIYSISHEYSNILLIHPQPAVSLPESLALEQESQPDTGAPDIAGRSPQHSRYLANGELCYEAMSLAGLMQDAVDGMLEYERLLGRQQATRLDSTPQEYRTPCFLSRYIHAPGRHLAQGLPVQVWDAAGFRRSLLNYDHAARVSGSLFTVPGGYSELVLGEAVTPAD
jgi:hypothetical protein